MMENSKTGNNVVEPMNSRGGVRNGLAYLLVGGGIGATLALLFAPKPGSELRAEIADASRKGYEATLEKVNDLGAQSAEVLELGKEKAKSILDLASSKLNIGKEVIEDVANTSSLAAAIVDGKDKNQSGSGKNLHQSGNERKSSNTV